jgi:hypothetical protein
VYVALFNLDDEKRDIAFSLASLSVLPSNRMYEVRNLWEKKDCFPLAKDALLSVSIQAHGCMLFRLQ